MENHIKYSKAVSWFNDCRIPFVDDTDKGLAKPQGKITSGSKGNIMFQYTEDKTRHELPDKQTPQGRFPANLLVSDDMLNDGSITKQSQRTYKPTDNTSSLFGNSPQAHGIGIGDKGTNSRYYDIDKWFNKIIE